MPVRLLGYLCVEDSCLIGSVDFVDVGDGRVEDLGKVADGVRHGGVETDGVMRDGYVERLDGGDKRAGDVVVRRALVWSVGWIQVCTRVGCLGI